MIDEFPMVEDFRVRGLFRPGRLGVGRGQYFIRSLLDVGDVSSVFYRGVSGVFDNGQGVMVDVVDDRGGVGSAALGRVWSEAFGLYERSVGARDYMVRVDVGGASDREVLGALWLVVYELFWQRSEFGRVWGGRALADPRVGELIGVRGSRVFDANHLLSCGWASFMDCGVSPADRNYRVRRG